MLDVDPAGVQAFMCPKTEGRWADSWRPDLEEMISMLKNAYDMDDRGWIEVPADRSDWLAFAKEAFQGPAL